MREILLTLGHNSSAILVENGRLVCGYETERVTGVKSDSGFPLPAIEYMRQHGHLKGRIDRAYVTHWHPSGMLASNQLKHWDPASLDGVTVRSLSSDFTHHDAHMRAAMLYAGQRFPYGQKTYGVVVDGFGIFGEHFSIYELTANGTMNLKRRIHGYDTSLGLWYQYATAFMGMKMHEDEYKILGYEAHVPPDRAQELQAEAAHKAELWLDFMGRSVYGSKFDPMYEITALAKTKDLHFSHLTDVCRRLRIGDPSSEHGRILLGYYVQAVLERVVLAMVAEFGPTHLVLSGGVFHNVKLNKQMMDLVDGRICVMPLCGDQGNALGLYSSDNPQFEMPDHLCWGLRNLEDKGYTPNLHYVEDDWQALGMMREMLDRYGYANIVRGGMEFGPRALCNTSTIAKPSLDVVARINAANNRNTIMPMAPAVSDRQYRQLFEATDKPWRSERHMIMAMEYAGEPMAPMLGIAHGYEVPYQHWTGRPQVIGTRDHFMNSLLDEYGPLINTSFNFHGKPIALDMESVILNHLEQYRRDHTFHTIVIKS